MIHGILFGSLLLDNHVKAFVNENKVMVTCAGTCRKETRLQNGEHAFFDLTSQTKFVLVAVFNCYIRNCGFSCTCWNNNIFWFWKYGPRSFDCAMGTAWSEQIKNRRACTPPFTQKINIWRFILLNISVFAQIRFQAF